MYLIDPLNLCPDCSIIKTPRSRHCSTCNFCVERYDHHCPWVNNCIGAKNHHYFMTFLTLVFVSCLTMIFNTIVGLAELKVDHSPERNHSIFAIVPDEFLLSRTSFILASIIVLLMTGFFIMPVSLLFYI